MTRWQPHIDLARLLAALDREILAASAEEVRMAYLVDRRAMRAAAGEVKRLIAQIVDEPERDGDPDPALALLNRGGEHRIRQH